MKPMFNVEIFTSVVLAILFVKLLARGKDILLGSGRIADRRHAGFAGGGDTKNYPAASK